MAYKYEKNYTGGQDIVIDGWEKGIAQSPYSGMADIRAVNVSDIPGAVFASTATRNDLLSYTTETAYLGVSATFTADASTDRITVSGITQEWEYTVVQFTTTGTLPAGLSLSTNYYLRYITTTGVYKVATSLANAIAGTYVNITDAGTGTHTATSTNIGVISATTKDDRSGNIYAVDENNRVWCSNIPGGTYKWMLIIGNTLTDGTGNGIAVWQNYLIVFRGSAIDVFGALDSFATATWTNGWNSMNSASSSAMLHKTYVASNNILYWCDYAGNTGGLRNPGYIGSLALATTSTFDPSSSSTYIFNNQALDLPDNEQPVALSELNGNLVIGVNLSGTNTSGSTSKLYYWDTFSASFNIPLVIPEAPIYEISNANNIIYVFCGWRGRVYKTNLSQVVLAFKVPDHLYYPFNSSTGYEGLPLYGDVSYTPTGGSVKKIIFGNQAKVTRKKIIFGVNLYGSTALYSYDTETNLLQIDAKPVNGYGSKASDSPKIYAVEVLNSTNFTLGTEILFFGTYYNGTTSYTIERFNPIYVSGVSIFGSYNGSIITDFIAIGTTNNKKTFEQLEYVLDRPMISGSGLKFYYRNNIGEDWTLLSTEDYTTYGAIGGRVISFSPTGKFVQIKVEFNPYTVLRQVRLR